jgi:hypothetical protein
LTSRSTEKAALELRNGLYRLIEISWNSTAAEERFDYFHAAFEVDGRWNAEFYDEHGRSVWAYGNEDTSSADWVFRNADQVDVPSVSSASYDFRITVKDIGIECLPDGSLCQTVEEREDGIPRYWKKWRII